MVLAKPLYDKGFRMLLSEGVTLTDRYIRRIKAYRFPYIYIHEEGTEEVVATDLVDISSRKEVYTVFQQYIPNEEKSKTVKKTVQQTAAYKSAKSGRIWMMKRAADSFIHGLLGSTAKLYYPNVSMATDANFNHAVDVASLAILIGFKFHYTQDEMNRLAQAAFLHDIGKASHIADFEDVHALDRTEEQQKTYELHPEQGAALLEEDYSTDPRILMAIHQHHERQDGSGFPEKLTGSGKPPFMERKSPGQIFRLAEIIAIADYYDNLIKGMVTKSFITPLQAVEMIIQKTPSWFNPYVTEAAISVINILPIGSNVIVEDCRMLNLVHYRGVVSKINLVCLGRPQVVLLYDDHRKKLPEPIYFDFGQDSTARLIYTVDL